LTESSIRELLEITTEKQTIVLEAMAARPFVTLEELATQIGQGATEDTVDGVMGSLAKKTLKLGIKDGNGNPSWPFWIGTEPHINKSVYLMPKAVAEIVKPGSRASAKPWEL
jgi:hypothetical protein